MREDQSRDRTRGVKTESRQNETEMRRDWDKRQDREREKREEHCAVYFTVATTPIYKTQL